MGRIYLQLPRENMIGTVDASPEVHKQMPGKTCIKLQGYFEARRSVNLPALEYEIYRHLLPRSITATVHVNSLPRGRKANDHSQKPFRQDRSMK